MSAPIREVLHVDGEIRHRRNHDTLRYPSDLTDDEWRHIEPLIPSAKRGGRRREVNVREVLNGVVYVLGRN